MHLFFLLRVAFHGGRLGLAYSKAETMEDQRNVLP